MAARYTAETGPMRPTDGDRLRSALALDRVAPGVGVIKGEADQYGLFRFGEGYEHPWDEATKIRPGIDAFGLRIHSSFWIPSLVGAESRRVAIATERTSVPEPVLIVGEGKSAYAINPLKMTGDPRTQAWLVNVYETGPRQIDQDGVVRDPSKALPDLTPAQAKLLFRVADAQIGFDHRGSSRRRQLETPRNSGFQKLDKRVVRVDPSLAGQEVFLVTPYVPGRGNRNTTAFRDGVVLPVTDREPIDRQIATESVPLSAWVEQEFAFRAYIHERASAVTR